MKMLLSKMLNNTWLFRGIGISLVVLAIVLFGVFDIVALANGNWFLYIPFLVVIVIGVIITSLAFGIEELGGVDLSSILQRGKRVVRTSGRAKTSGSINSILITVKRDRKGELIPRGIRFLHIKKPCGQLRKVENDGKYYYVFLHEIENKSFYEQILPDTIYLNPRQYKIPLTMPANEEYWKPVVATWQKVAPFAIVVVIIIEWITYTTTVI